MYGKKPFNKLIAYIELIRPFTLIAPGVCFLGAGVIAWSIAPRPDFSQIIIVLLCGSISVALLNAASNSINQFYDYKIDMINKPSRPLPSGKLTKNEALCAGLIIYVISLSFALYVFLQGRRQFFFMLCLAVVFTVLYSVPPFRTKRFTILSNLTIALPRGFIIVAGWSVVRNLFEIQPWAIGTVFFLYILGAASTKDFSDMKGDAKYGCMTLPVRYGIGKSAKIIAPFFILPWILFLPLSYFKIINGSITIIALLVLVLVLWGVYIARLLTGNPKMFVSENHIAWKHMYLIIITAYLGIVFSYLV